MSSSPTNASGATTPTGGMPFEGASLSASLSQASDRIDHDHTLQTSGPDPLFTTTRLRSSTMYSVSSGYESPNTPRPASPVISNADPLNPNFYYLNGNGTFDVPPNTPAHNLSPVATRVVPRTRIYASLDEEVENQAREPNPSIDFRSLTYISPVNENLICPICQSALIDPVETECDHTFCKQCLVEALKHSQRCPIDREPCSAERPFSRSSKVILNQLDALLVKCDACDVHVPRAMLQHHIDRYCKEGLVYCHGKEGCHALVKRRIAEQGACLHYDAACPDCHEIFQEVNMNSHRQNHCTKKDTNCEHCGAGILRLDEDRHHAICSDVVAPCQWAEYGCKHESKRKDLEGHVDQCELKLLGPLANMLKKEVIDLREEVRDLNERDQLKDRRIKFLENGQRDTVNLDSSEVPSSDYPDLISTSPLDSTTSEYLLNLLGDQERHVQQLATGIMELESRQSRLIFEQIMTIKNELVDMRNSQQVTNMHVRWLMQIKRQEAQARQAGLSISRFRSGDGNTSFDNGSSEGSGGSSANLMMGRRLSDTTRDLGTKL